MGREKTYTSFDLGGKSCSLQMHDVFQKNKIRRPRWVSIRKKEVKPEERETNFHDQIKLLAQ